MMLTLIRKLLRDVRLPLLVLVILLIAFQCLWTKIIDRITGQLLPQLVSDAASFRRRQHTDLWRRCDDR